MTGENSICLAYPKWNNIWWNCFCLYD